jgi:hypothetical protein
LDPSSAPAPSNAVRRGSQLKNLHKSSLALLLIDASSNHHMIMVVITKFGAKQTT